METDDPRQAELLSKIREGIDSMLTTVKEIDERLLASSKQLRVDQGSDAFMVLSSAISNLGDLVDLVREIKSGIAHLASKSVPANAFDSWERSIALFREMLTALEGKDWITLADLIQYELSPLLAEGEKDLSRVRDLLSGP
jgi:hypothetical protein